MQYLVFKSNFKNTLRKHFQADFEENTPIYKNKISLKHTRVLLYGFLLYYIIYATGR